MRMTERGQVTIPKYLREKYGIHRSTELAFLEKEEGLLLVKAHSLSPLHRFRGIAGKRGEETASTDEFLSLLRDEDDRASRS